MAGHWQLFPVHHSRKSGVPNDKAPFQWKQNQHQLHRKQTAFPAQSMFHGTPSFPTVLSLSMLH